MALHISWKDLAEVRSLAVAERAQRNGVGAQLVAAAIDDAVAFGVSRVFALTFVPGFFAKLSFRQVDKSDWCRARRWQQRIIPRALPRLYRSWVKCIKYHNNTS